MSKYTGKRKQILMQIKDAILRLKKAKAQGVKNVIINWWEAENFNLVESPTWEKACRQASTQMEWDSAQEDLENLVSQAARNAGYAKNR
jgi:hypothetical protein